MKKNKLLIPLITLAGVTATVAPVMCLTSCTQGEKEETHFKFETGGVKTYEAPYVGGQVEYTFTCTDTEFKEEQAKLVEVYAKITKANSYITLQNCSRSYDVTAKTITVIIGYSIDPAAFEHKTNPEKIEYNIVIHNGTWIQTETGFSITAKM